MLGRVALPGLLGGRDVERFDVCCDLRNGASVSYVSGEHLDRPYLSIEDYPLAKITGAIANGDMPSIVD